MNADGARTWFIPDGYLARPVDDDPDMKNHEAFCIINTRETDAILLLDFYFEDRPPAENIQITIPAKRCCHVRTDKPEQLGGFVIPFDVPYGVRIRSDVPVVVQYSRLYAGHARPMTVMTTLAYPVNEA